MVAIFLRHILSVTSKPLTLLVTGFGAFPGAPQNPTRLLIKRLERHQSRLARQGIRLELAILPVVYEDLPKALMALHEDFKPDAILHFGLASRRRFVSLEVRAKNHLSQLHIDASGKRAKSLRVISGGPAQLAARFPVIRLKAQLTRARLRPQISNEAGDYICNQAFYLSLTRPVPLAAFIHVPKLSRLNLKNLERAALIAIGLCRRPWINPLP